MHKLTFGAIRLPADYVAQHLELGYAPTIHGAKARSGAPYSLSQPDFWITAELNLRTRLKQGP